MSKNTFFIISLLLIGFIFRPQFAQATHYHGATMTYECLGSNIYRLHHRVYRDCSGPTPVPPSTTTITGIGGSCNQPVAGAWTLAGVKEATAYSPGIVTTCLSPAAMVPGIEEWHYTRDYDFSGLNCTKFILKWGECCRNSSLTNIPSSSAAGIIADTIKLSLGCNSSPQWRRPPPFVVFSNHDNYFDLGAFDTDGDSLAFKLTNVLNDAYNPIPYNPGHSALQPLGPNWNLTLDEKTGLIGFHPISGSPVTAAVAVMVEEFRNGQKIGASRVDFQVVSQNSTLCTTQMPIISNPFGFQNCAFINGEIVVAPGTTGCFELLGHDPDLNSLILTWLPTLPNVVVTDTFGLGPDSVSGLRPYIRVCITAPASFGTDELTITAIDTNCQTNNMSVAPFTLRYGAPGLVWPGDADNDLVANAVDLLPIGLAFGSTGTARGGASNAWFGQLSAPWQDTITGAIDKKFIDCNGDGTINADDTLAIVLNYGLVHSKSNEAVARGTVVDPPLLLQMPQSANVGDTIEVPIILGTASVNANNIYGYSFTIQYNSSVIDSASFYIEWNNSWLGNSSNSLDLYRNDSLNSACDASQVRTNHSPVSGFGEVARAHFVIIDNIDGKRQELDSADLELNFSFVKVIGSQGETIQVDASGDTMTIYMVGNISSPISNANIDLAPNPASSQIKINANGQLIQNLELTDIRGIRLYSLQKPNETQIQMDVTQFPKGIYFLKVETEGNFVVKKIVLE